MTYCLGYLGLIALMIIGMYVLRLTMEAEEASHCPWPRFGGKQVYHLYDDVWVCRHCWKAYRKFPGDATRVSKGNASDALSQAIHIAEEYDDGDIINHYFKISDKMTEAYEEVE